MYLNDCQRSYFYESLGLDTKQFDMHVIIEVISELITYEQILIRNASIFRPTEPPLEFSLQFWMLRILNSNRDWTNLLS